MRRRANQRQQCGNYWLWQRPDNGVWCICWLEHRPHQRSVTRRKVTAYRGEVGTPAPQEAVDALAAHHLQYSRPSSPQAADDALVENLLAEWVTHHLPTLQAPDRYLVSVDHWTNFFDVERKAGRLPAAITVKHLTPPCQSRFREYRFAMGVGGHTVSRDLAALRGALTWAWKSQLIEHPPFIMDIPTHQKAPARDRVLSIQEVAALMDACADREDREHLLRFMVIELGIAGRPEAVLELTSANIDLERGLIDPNQPGRVHARKRRAIVPIAAAVRPWVSGIEGKIITYRTPIAERNRQPNGPTHFVRPTRSIKTGWHAICEEVGIADATPKTLRHTMLTWLAERGVPKEQRMALAGHAAQDTTAKNYEHLTPTYLTTAVAEIDAFFVELANHTKAHLRYENDTGSIEPLAA